MQYGTYKAMQLVEDVEQRNVSTLLIADFHRILKSTKLLHVTLADPDVETYSYIYKYCECNHVSKISCRP